MDTQNIHNLQEAYLEVYDLDEKSVSWGYWKNCKWSESKGCCCKKTSRTSKFI